MFLVRTAFWLSIVILLIPADPQSNAPAPRVSMFEALSSARTAIADFSNFCERNADVCSTSAAAFRVFAEKAQNAARLLFRYVDGGVESNGADDNPGTLMDSDRIPAWRGPRESNAA